MKLFKELLKLLKPFWKKNTFILYLKDTTNFRELGLFLSFRGRWDAHDGATPHFFSFFSHLLSIFFVWERSRVWGRWNPVGLCNWTKFCVSTLSEDFSWGLVNPFLFRTIHSYFLCSKCPSLELVGQGLKISREELCDVRAGKSKGN